MLVMRFEEGWGARGARVYTAKARGMHTNSAFGHLSLASKAVSSCQQVIFRKICLVKLLICPG